MIKAFLVGLGSIGMGYDFEDSEALGLTHSRALENHTSFDFVGCFDIDSTKRIEIVKKYHVPVFENLLEGLRVTEPDLVVIAVPTEFHLEILTKVLNALTPKAILCEKPIVGSPEEIDSILSLMVNKSTRVFVNYFRNSDPVVLSVRDEIALEQSEEPFSARGTYNKGLIHTGSHFLNLLEILFGEVQSIEKLEQVENNFNILDPNVALLANFKNGSALLTPSLDPDSLKFEMVADFPTKSLVYMDEGETVAWIPKSDEVTQREVLSKFNLRRESKRYQFDVLNEIAKYFDNQKYSLCELSDALRYVVLLGNLQEL